MKHKPMRRILAGLLAGMLCLSMTPGAAFAEDRSGHAGDGHARNGAQP